MANTLLFAILNHATAAVGIPRESRAAGVGISYAHVGTDISCNLGSLNIAAAIDGGDLGATVETAVRALTAVSELSAIDAVPRSAAATTRPTPSVWVR
jgi:hypothetical protein